jgi:glutamyl-tRNA reductase
MTNSLASLHCCAWRTVSLRATEMAAAQASMRARHEGAAIVTSCQRLEAYSLHPCACDAPEQLDGFAALERLAAVAAGLESAVLGEAQVMGQVREAFAETAGELRAMADLAVSSARALRNEVRFESHAGHLLDRALKLSTMTPGGRLLVLGAGAMGKLVAARAQELGFEVTVAARREPSLPAGQTFIELGRVPELIRVDVIVGCLGSGAGEIAPRYLPAARLLVDLGTPRNFNVPSGPGAIAIADMLEDEAQRPHAVARRARLRARLGQILESRLARAGETSGSPVGAMRADIEAIRQAELARFQKLHPEIPAEALDAITRSLLDKVFHAPTVRLKTLDEDLAREVARLFAN